MVKGVHNVENNKLIKEITLPVFHTRLSCRKKIFEMIKTVRQEQQKQYLRLMFTAVSDNTRPWVR